MATKEEMSRIGKSNVRRGKSNERAVAKLLKEFTGVEFRRRRVEGRDSTVVERESTADVIPVSGEILFSIEVKCGKCPSMDSLLVDPLQNLITKWWHQATYDAQLLTSVLVTNKQTNRYKYVDGRNEKVGYFPLLFFKPGNGFNWIAIDQSVFRMRLLKPKAGCSTETEPVTPWMPCYSFDYYDQLGPITHDISHSRKNKEKISLHLPSLYFMRWKDFAATVEPSSLFI